MDRRTLLKTLGATAFAATGLTLARPAFAAEGVDWEALRRSMRGPVFLPGSPEFEQARFTFNPLADHQVPAAVAQCHTADDVAAVVRATAGKMPMAPRSGGHSYAGYSVPQGGLVIDVRPMSTVELREDGTAVIGAGARLGEVYDVLGRAGRCLPAGTCPTVGISGLTLGGGIGVLTRKYGLTCDRLLAAEIVTADGEVRTVSAESEPELFWALRGGGGGNFGVVTSLTFSTEPAPELTVFSLWFPPDRIVDVFRAWQSWIADAPPELWSNLHVDSDAEPKCHVAGCFVGTSAQANPLLDELARLAGVEPDRRMAEDKNYLDAMAFFSGSSDRECFVASSRIVSEPVEDPAPVVDLLRGERGVSLIVDSLGGAVSEVDSTASAFPHRQVLASAQVYASATPENQAAVRDRVHRITLGLADLGIDGGYVNYIDHDLPDWERAYYGDNRTRLRKVADTYDPDRVFGFAQGIPG